MRSGLTQFRNHISVKQVLVHLNSTGGRRRSLGRSSVILSNRGSGASSSDFNPRRVARCNPRHSSTGTNTATSTPRRVTTCGPSSMAESSNSLNRAFASCTGHEAPYLSIVLIVVTSQTSSRANRYQALVGRCKLPASSPAHSDSVTCSLP